MRDKDQHLLWESYMESKHTSKDTKDDDHTEKKKGKYDDGDGKTEKCDFIPCKEGTDGSTDDLTDSEKEKLKKEIISESACLRLRAVRVCIFAFRYPCIVHVHTICLVG